jgi:hypothetical protein
MWLISFVKFSDATKDGIPPLLDKRLVTKTKAIMPPLLDKGLATKTKAIMPPLLALLRAT